MCAHTPNQFSEYSFAGWPGVEQQRRRAVRIREDDKFFNRKIDIGKVGVIARPTFCNRCHGRTQNLAALHIRGTLFLLGRLGMKRTFALRCDGLSRQRAEGAMIGDRDPGKDRKRDGDTARGCLHADFNRRRVAIAQMFSFGLTSGAISPTATPDGGTTSSVPV